MTGAEQNTLAVKAMARLMTVPFERGADILPLTLLPVDADQATVKEYDFLDHIARFGSPPDPRYLLVQLVDVAIDTAVRVTYKIPQPGGAPAVQGAAVPVIIPAGSLKGSSFPIDLGSHLGDDVRLLGLSVEPPTAGKQAADAWRLIALLGNISRLLWVIGWEQDHIRRQMELVKAQRQLSDSVGLSLDLTGYDLGIPRFPPLPYSFDNNKDTIALYHMDDQPLWDSQKKGTIVKDITGLYKHDAHDGVNIKGLAVQGVPGRFGSSFLFKSPKAEIVIENHTDFDLEAGQDFTVECFVKPEPGAGKGHIISKHANPDEPSTPGWALSIGEFERGLPQNIRFMVSDGDRQRIIFVDESLPTSGFTHLAGIIDRKNKEVRLYMNGDLRARDSITGFKAFTNTEPIRMSWTSTPAFAFRGSIDEVRISGLARLNFDPVFGETDSTYRRRLRIFEHWTLPTPGNLLAALNDAIGEIGGDPQPIELLDEDSNLIGGSLQMTIYPKILSPGECIDSLGQRRVKEAAICGTAADEVTFDPVYLVAHDDPARVRYQDAPSRDLARGELPPDPHKMQVAIETHLTSLLDRLDVLPASGTKGKLVVLSAFDPRAGDLRAVGRGLLLGHETLNLGQLAALAHRSGFAFVCWKPADGGVYASTEPGDYLKITRIGGTASGADGVDLHVGETLKLDVRPTFGPGALYQWQTIHCGNGRADFQTRADKPSVTLQATAPGKLVVKIEVTLQQRIISATQTFRVGLVELEDKQAISAEGALDVNESVVGTPDEFFHTAYLVTHQHTNLVYTGGTNSRRMQPALVRCLDHLMALIAIASGTGKLQVSEAYKPGGPALSAVGRAVTIKLDPSMTLSIGRVAALAHAAGFTYVERNGLELRLRMGPAELVEISGPEEVAEDERLDPQKQPVLQVLPQASPAGVVLGAKALYLVNMGTDTMSEIDLQSGRVQRALKVGWKPTALAVNPGENRLYSADSAGNTITAIDLASGKQLAEIPVGNHPVAVALHPNTPRLYTACQGANSLYQLDCAALKVMNSLSLEARPRGMAIRPNGAELWVALDLSKQVAIVDTANFKLIASIPLSGQPEKIVFSLDGTRAYATLPADKKIAVLNVAGRAVLGEVTLSTTPSAIAVAPDGSTLYLTNTGGKEQLQLWDIQTAAPFLIWRASIPVRKEPVGIAVGADRVYVINKGSSEISVIEIQRDTYQHNKVNVDLYANWRLGSGLGESLIWMVSSGGVAKASLSSTTALQVRLKGEHAGPLLVRAVFSLEDRTAPYLFVVRLKLDLQKVGARIQKEQYDLIMNILNAFHPIGVEVSTRALREQVIEIGAGLLDALPDYTYPNFRVRGPAPRPYRKE